LDQELLEIINGFSASISSSYSKVNQMENVAKQEHRIKCYLAALEAQKSIRLNYSQNLILEKMFVSFL
jgi:NifU-like protein involved in Fe-S cluster formation